MADRVVPVQLIDDEAFRRKLGWPPKVWCHRKDCDHRFSVVRGRKTLTGRHASGYKPTGHHGWNVKGGHTTCAVVDVEVTYPRHKFMTACGEILDDRMSHWHGEPTCSACRRALRGGLPVSLAP
jgi:hypothetical protein